MLSVAFSYTPLQLRCKRKLFQSQPACAFNGTQHLVVWLDGKRILAARVSVETESSTAVAYQWQLDGQPVGGATNRTLAVVNATLEDAGEYHVCRFELFWAA